MIFSLLRCVVMQCLLAPVLAEIKWWKSYDLNCPVSKEGTQQECVSQHKMGPSSFAEITHSVRVPSVWVHCHRQHWVRELLSALLSHSSIPWAGLIWKHYKQTSKFKQIKTIQQGYCLYNQSSLTTHSNSECFHVATVTGACFAFFRQPDSIYGQ